MPLRNPAVDWEPWKSKEMRKVTVDKFIAFYTVDTRSSVSYTHLDVYKRQGESRRTYERAFRFA